MQKYVCKNDYDVTILESLVCNLLYDIPLPSPGRSVRYLNNDTYLLCDKKSSFNFSNLFEFCNPKFKRKSALLLKHNFVHNWIAFENRLPLIYTFIGYIIYIFTIVYGKIDGYV